MLTGWHGFQVYCNGLRIASFMTERLQKEFIAARSARWPQNKYRTRSDEGSSYSYHGLTA